MKPSSVHSGGERKTSTSDDRANWGIFVSNLVETITVLESSGSTYKWKHQAFRHPYQRLQATLHWPDWKAGC